MTDFLTEKRREINARLSELKPLVEEYRQLEAAAQALEGVGGRSTGGGSTTGNGRRRGPGRPRGSRNRTTGTRTGARRGRRRGGNTRAAQALELVKGNPGITIPELAQSMGIKQNYLYRVMPGLETDGQVRRKGKGWHPK